MCKEVAPGLASACPIEAQLCGVPRDTRCPLHFRHSNYVPSFHITLHDCLLAVVMARRKAVETASTAGQAKKQTRLVNVLSTFKVSKGQKEL